MGTENLFTTTYHPKVKPSSGTVYRTIMSGLRYYIAYLPKYLDLYTEALTCAYHMQSHHITNFAHFYLVLSKPPVPLAITPFNEQEDAVSPRDYVNRWKAGNRNLVSVFGIQMRDEQKCYKCNITSRVRLPVESLLSCRFAFVRTEHYEQQQKQKFSPVADGPFQIISADNNTVRLLIREEDELVPHDLVTEAPPARDTRSHSAVSTVRGINRTGERRKLPTVRC